jgi:glutaminyl-tRNA synthetase
MYDFAHPIEDAIEGLTHSYARWNLKITGRFMTGSYAEVGWWQTPPRQIEFARLKYNKTVRASVFEIPCGKRRC